MSEPANASGDSAGLVERLRLPISESMFVRKLDMLHALFAEREEAATRIADLEAKLAAAEKAAVTAVIPLEVLLALGNADGRFSEHFWSTIHDGVNAVREMALARARILT